MSCGCYLTGGIRKVIFPSVDESPVIGSISLSLGRCFRCGKFLYVCKEVIDKKVSLVNQDQVLCFNCSEKSNQLLFGGSHV